MRQRLLRSAITRKNVLIIVAAWVGMLSPAHLRADLQCAQPVVNAGRVRTGTPLVQQFTLTNGGSEVVEITDARASCGCLTPRLSHRRFQAGQQGTLTLEINTLSQAAGPHTWTVRVLYRSGNASSELPLQLSAHLVAEVIVQPSALTVYADKVAAHDLALTDVRPQPLCVTAVEISSPKLKPRVSGPVRDEEGHRLYKINIEAAADYPEGRQDEVLHIYTDDVSYRDLKVPVTVIKRVPQRLSATPNAVALKAPPGQPFPSRIVLIRDSDNQGVKIEHVMVDDPAITCRWAEGPGPLATVKIQVDRTQTQGKPFHSAVHIQISKPVRETLTVPVTGAVP
jgi:hypothetical protein